ncbi:hypothetical protein [Methylorubrum thiocyanatum]|uniref:hypothetical protein n=1 Tax=Methylorubrum thiocyanatum TaxID=47958 RepID=UPI003F813905
MRFKRRSLAEIAALNRARDEDLARLAAGWEPSPEALAAAPTLSYWVEFTPEGASKPVLLGHLKGHPRALDGWTTTDEILARGDGWVRTHHSWLRLGPPAPPRPHMQPREPEPAREPAPVPEDPDADGLLAHLPDYSQPGPRGR